MNQLDDFLSERHDLSRATKEHYRMAFQALCRYTDHPFSLSRREMNECLGKMARDYKPGSWNSYVACIRVVYKWLNGGEEYPDAVKKIRLKRIRKEDYIKTKLLSDAEVQAMVRAADNPRDRAFIAVAACTGARKGELLNMKIRDIAPNPNGYEVVVSGKTGTHPAPPIVKGYAKVLRVWLEHHPLRHNPDAPLWLKFRSGGKIDGIRESQAHNIVKRVAKLAGLKRNIHLHMFRHTENTWETKSGVAATARRQLHGWSPTSSTPSLYEHFSGKDAVESVLRARGIVSKEDEQVDQLGLVKCVYCGEENQAEGSFCMFCGVPLKGDQAEQFKAMERLWRFLGNERRLKRFERWMDKLMKEEE